MSEHPEPGDHGRHRTGVLTPLLLLALVAGTVVAVWMVRDRDARLDASRSAEEAARAVALHMVTYDSESLETDFDWVEKDGSEEFAETFRVSADQVREMAAATGAHSEGAVLASGVHVVNADKAEVVIALDAEITQRSKLTPDPQRWRLRLTMVRQGDRWLVDRLELL